MVIQSPAKTLEQASTNEKLMGFFRLYAVFGVHRKKTQKNMAESGQIVQRY